MTNKTDFIISNCHFQINVQIKNAAYSLCEDPSVTCDVTMMKLMVSQFSNGSQKRPMCINFNGNSKLDYTLLNENE